MSRLRTSRFLLVLVRRQFRNPHSTPMAYKWGASSWVTTLIFPGPPPTPTPRGRIRSMGGTQRALLGDHNNMPSSAQQRPPATNNNDKSANARASCSKAPAPSSVKFGTAARATATAADTRGSVSRNPVPQPSVGVPRRVCPPQTTAFVLIALDYV